MRRLSGGRNARINYGLWIFFLRHDCAFSVATVRRMLLYLSLLPRGRFKYATILSYWNYSLKADIMIGTFRSYEPCIEFEHVFH